MKDSDELRDKILCLIPNPSTEVVDNIMQAIQAHYQAQATGDELEQIIRFLLGETMLDGMWFGDQDSSKPLYWWRIPLRKALERQHPND
jgi:hypothetical protein